jgi:hypothetical protein
LPPIVVRTSRGTPRQARLAVGGANFAALSGLSFLAQGPTDMAG